MIYGTHQSLRDTLGDLGDVVEETVKQLEPHRIDFDHIIVTGVSGIVVGAPVSLALGKNLLVARKSGEDCHNYHPLVGAKLVKNGDRVLFLDDFVSSGNTRRRCQRALLGLGERIEARIVAQYEYQDIEYRVLNDDEQPKAINGTS
jgi:adenine/guanine phosphoribosyltransferase-like PRPP-binding protein